MYTIAICDGNKNSADALRMSIHNVLDHLKITHIIYYYKDSGTLYKTLKKYPEKYNFLFLETALHPMDGITLAKKLRHDKYKGNIVMISENSDHVFDGYDVDACQYFLKPVPEENLHRLFFRLSAKTLQDQSSHYLLLHYGTTHHKIRYSDILYIETANRKIAIHTQTENAVIYYPCKLSDIEELLPSTLFLRCHQSFILQFEAIKYISKSIAYLIDGTEIPISRSYKEIVLSTFNSMQEND